MQWLNSSIAQKLVVLMCFTPPAQYKFQTV